MTYFRAKPLQAKMGDLSSSRSSVQTAQLFHSRGVDYEGPLHQGRKATKREVDQGLHRVVRVFYNKSCAHQISQRYVIESIHKRSQAVHVSKREDNSHLFRQWDEFCWDLPRTARIA